MNHNCLVGNELLISLFTHFPKDESIPIEKGLVILDLFEASKKPEYKNLFENYHFDTNHDLVYSTQLEDAFFLLMIAHVVIFYDFSKDCYVGRGVDISYEKFVKKRLLPGEEELLKEIADEILIKVRVTV
ncbi:MAG: hypothetical protein OEX08_02230 [Candidatus Nomurabacteria bacterium]|nr:hypothetical protein [Candidatus Nomurabacteria bacterium]